MTLRDYIDDINTSLVAQGYVENPFPDEFMRRLVNKYRRYVAQVTRCLECWNEADSVSGQGEYQKPVDCITVLDVFYDGRLLEWLNKREMNYLRQDAIVASGTPTHWADYGGENQPSGYIFLHPIPNETNKIIKIQTIQLPQDFPITDLTRAAPTVTEDELPLTVQWLVEEGARIELLKNKGREPRFPIMWAEWNRRLKQNINLRGI